MMICPLGVVEEPIRRTSRNVKAGEKQLEAMTGDELVASGAQPLASEINRHAFRVVVKPRVSQHFR
jgi:hypothetical protein